MGTDTIIILPAHNEAANIGRVIAEVRAAIPDADVVVIDDASIDATADIAVESGAIVLPLPVNLGYGVALQTGYKFAAAGGYHFLVQLDSDGQHDPASIPKLLEIARSGKCDVCIGSRFLEGEPYPIPFARRAGMWLFRRLASVVLGHTITDPTSGFQAMNRRAFEFFTRDSYPTDFPDTNVIVMLHVHGFRVLETPVVMHRSTTGKSIHSGWRPLYYLFKMALDIPLNLLRREH
jgi:glycosyltransferase involved in cell wall biosynthesis